MVICYIICKHIIVQKVYCIAVAPRHMLFCKGSLRTHIVFLIGMTMDSCPNEKCRWDFVALASGSAEKVKGWSLGDRRCRRISFHTWAILCFFFWVVDYDSEMLIFSAKLVTSDVQMLHTLHRYWSKDQVQELFYALGISGGRLWPE